VRVVSGRAPGSLVDLPDPDAVFVGGGGEQLEAILDLCAARTARAVVVALAVIDRAPVAMERLAAHGLRSEATMIQASRLAPLAGGHRLAAQNPVLLICGARS